MISDIIEKQQISVSSITSVLKAFLLGYEIETSCGTFKYFRKGDWIELGDNMEGEIAEEGVFKRCDVVSHTRITLNECLSVSSHRWLLWFNTIPDLIHFVESISPAELAIISANLTINNLK